MKLFILVLFALVFVAKEAAAQACHMREVDLCMALGMFHYQSNGVPSDEEKVDEWCATMQEVGECMGNFSAKCLSPMQRELIGLFAGAEDVGVKLCTPGSEVRAGYLKHAECIAEGTNSAEFKGHIRNLQVSLENTFEAKFDQRIATLCCGFRRFDSGVKKSVTAMCGAEAVDVVGTMMKTLTTDLPTALCARYDPGSDECQKVLPPLGTAPQGGAGKSQLGKMLDTVFGNM